MLSMTAIICDFGLVLVMLTCLIAGLFAPLSNLAKTPVPTTPSSTPTLALQAAHPTVNAVFQQFEHGWMLWRADANCVYVYSYSARPEGNILIPSEISFKPFGNYHYCLEVASLPARQRFEAAPDGLQTPTGTLGKVWGAYQELRDSLGYAVASEQAYVATIPRNICYDEFTCSYAPPLLTLPDGRVLSCGMRAASAGTCTVR